MTRAILGFLFLSIFLTHCAEAHKEWVHQYTVKEAYRFLESKVGGPILDLKNHIGVDFYGYGDDNDPWATGYIGVGAWREDREDIVWGYGDIFDGWDPSSTHFWNADNGDNCMTPIPLSGNAYNAWYKARIYLFGGHRIFFAKKAFDAGIGQVILGRYYSYNSLAEFFNTGHCYYEGYVDIAGYAHIGSPQEIYMDLTSARNRAYELLGHVAHLLADMGVPAHVHNDLHPCDLTDPDWYEIYMGGNQIPPSMCNDPQTSFPAQSWTASTASAQGGLIDISSLTDQDAMRYLFYTQNQLADHFPSGMPGALDANGNNYLPNGTNSYLQTRYQALGQPPSNIDPVSIANECFNFTIRATATLFNWFAKKTGQSPVLPLSVSISGPISISAGTYTWTANVSGGISPYTFAWSQMWDCGGGLLAESPKASNMVQPMVPCNTWFTVGSNSSTLRIYVGGNCYLRVNVQDANHTNVSSQIHVSVGGGIQPSVAVSSFRSDAAFVTAAPEEYSVSQNYPNPFNPTTEIRFALPEPSHVRLSVYDMLGREVSRPADEQMDAGYHSVTWNASNVSSGVYIYRLSAGDFVQVKRMVVMK